MAEPEALNRILGARDDPRRSRVLLPIVLLMDERSRSRTVRIGQRFRDPEAHAATAGGPWRREIPTGLDVPVFATSGEAP
jgi:hypothetical protein